MEIYEKGENIVIEIPALNLDIKDIKIDIKNNILKIKGSKKISKEAKQEGYYAKEETESAVYNEIQLPFNIQEDKAKKIFKNNVLKIIVPKK